MTGAGENIVVSSDEVAAEAQAQAAKLREFLVKSRDILNADQLVSLVSPRARFEVDFPKLQAYFFTVDGVLHGKKITGALFGGEPILVFAPTFLRAQELANSGLRSTVEFAIKEYETRGQRAELSALEQGIAKDVAGRRSKEGDALAKLPKMRHMLEHVIGKMPWKW